VGIGGKGEPAQAMRARLDAYMDQQGISRQDAVFYSHALPSLATPSWGRNRVAGRGWLAVGDAGGLVDPITGEGLYYAIRSGDLASQVVLNDAHDLTDKALAYRAAVAREFAHDLEFAAMLARRVFLGRFLFRSVPQRMVHFMQRSPRFRDLMQDLFAGTQPYLSLRARLMKNLNGTLQEVFMQFFLDRVIPGQSRVIP
jgi:flavin-dependent dehydrogenase